MSTIAAMLRVSADTTRPRSRSAARLAGGVLALGAAAALGWAGATVFAPPEAVTAASPWTTVEVAPGEVGSSISLNTVVTWDEVPAGTNQAAGTVTTVDVATGDEVAAGQRLYSVDLRPVVAAQGQVPAFRPLARDDRGEDVRQLQDLLRATGHLTSARDAVFDAATERAVRSWQLSLGVERDGQVRQGDVVYLPTLPARVRLDDEHVTRGAALAGGESTVMVLAAQPDFTMPVDSTQAALMPVGTAVTLRVDDLTWQATVASHTPDTESGADMVSIGLAPAEGASICGDGCGRLPVGDRTIIPSTVVTQPTVEGLVVPSSALRSHADGEVVVVDGAGDEHTVTVVASARGMSVVEGVTAGLRVRVPADADPS